MNWDFSLHTMPMGDDEDSYDSDSSSSDRGEGDDVEEKGAMSQFGDSVKNMLVGFVLFILSFVVLFQFATCTEKGKEAGKAIPIEKAADGKFVFVSGTPVAAEIGDGATLKAGKYLRINKNVEYYSVIGEEKSKEKKKGVKKVTTKWIEYKLDWTSSPKPIKGKEKDRWKKFARENNLPLTIENPVVASGEKTSDTINTPKCEVAGYSINVKDVNFKDGSKDLDIITVKGDKDKPKVGDKRIKYTAYPSDIQYAFLGDKQGKTLNTHMYGNSASIEASTGDINKLKGALKKEDNMIWWIGLILGFLCMAGGLNMLVGPITTLLEFIPFVGELGAGLIKLVLTVVAAVISIVFYLLVYYWWIVLIIVAGIVGFLVYKKKSAAPAKA